jgi:predicted ATPase
LASFVEDQGAGRYRFQHALMRDVAYEGLPYRRRKQLHARVGNAILASTPDQAEVLSLHFFLAGDDRLAWRYSVIAARRAESAYANVEASRFFRRAIDVAERYADGLAGERERKAALRASRSPIASIPKPTRLFAICMTPGIPPV